MNESNTGVRILLADDHQLVRSGIRQLSESADACEGQEAWALSRTEGIMRAVSPGGISQGVEQPSKE